MMPGVLKTYVPKEKEHGHFNPSAQKGDRAALKFDPITHYLYAPNR